MDKFIAENVTAIYIRFILRTNRMKNIKKYFTVALVIVYGLVFFPYELMMVRKTGENSVLGKWMLRQLSRYYRDIIEP